MNIHDLHGKSLSDYISLISNLPSHFLKDIVPATPGEKKLIVAFKNFYRAKAAWLEHLVLKKSLTPEAITTDWKYYKPHAQTSAILLRLAEGVQLQSWLGEYFDSHEYLWAVTVVSQCNKALSYSGLVDKPQICGKKDWAEENLELLKNCEPQQKRFVLTCPVSRKNAESTLDWNYDTKTILIGAASDCARLNPNFDQEYWLPFKKDYSRWTYEIRNCKQLQGGCLLPNGELLVTDRRLPVEYKQELPLVTEKKGFKARRSNL